jgi:hypothetical protein
MDIHPPHHPITSVRDFLLQIFTITVGIVIALGLESLVQWRADENLARVTRADFKAEITENLANLEKLKPAMESDMKWMVDTIAYGEARLRHQNTKPPALLTSRNFATFSKTAWDTALATQAIHRLRFAEARQLASTYSKQAAINDLEDHAEHQWIALSSYGDVDNLDDQDVRSGLGNLRIAAAYTGSILNSEPRMVASYKAALAELDK